MDPQVLGPGRLPGNGARDRRAFRLRAVFDVKSDHPPRRFLSPRQHHYLPDRCVVGRIFRRQDGGIYENIQVHFIGRVCPGCVSGLDSTVGVAVGSGHLGGPPVSVREGNP